MYPLVHHEYHPNIIPDPPHESNCFDQYLESAQSSSSGLDSVGSQSGASSSVAASPPQWFTDFIQYDSDDTSFQADLKSVSQTSKSVRMELNSNVATVPQFASSPRAVPMSPDTFVPKGTGFCRRPYLTDLDEANRAVAFHSNMQSSQWNAMEPALNLYACKDSESVSGEDLQQISLAHSTSVQNRTIGKAPLVRMHYFYCPTCQHPCISEFRLSEHLRKCHPLVQSICNICYKGFTTNKDLRRHELIHERSRQSFACSCGKTYSRNDKLNRHITNMAQKPRDAGQHEAAEPNRR